MVTVQGPAQSNCYPLCRGTRIIFATQLTRGSGSTSFRNLMWLRIDEGECRNFNNSSSFPLITFSFSFTPLQFSNRLWNYVATGILVLTLANIFLTIRLFHTSQSPTIPVLGCSPHAPPPKAVQLPPTPSSPLVPTVDCDYGGIYSNYTQKSSHTVFGRLNLKLGRWDKTRSYKIHENVLVGDEFTSLSDKFSVCIATQSSLERLGSLVSFCRSG